MIKVPSPILLELLLTLGPGEIFHFSPVIYHNNDLWRALLTKCFPQVECSPNLTHREIFLSLIRSREIGIYIASYPQNIYQGSVVISNITTVANLHQLLLLLTVDPQILNHRTIGIIELLIEVSDTLSNVPPQYNVEMSVNKSFLVDLPNLSRFNDKLLLGELPTSSLDPYSSNFSDSYLSDTLQEIRCFPIKKLHY